MPTHRLLAALFFAACATPEDVPSAPEPAPPVAAAAAEKAIPARLPLDAPGGLADAVGQPVALEVRDLVVHVEGGEIRVPYLSGQLTPAKGGQLVDLEVPSSFEVTVDALEVVISEQTLQSALAAEEGSPLRDVVVRTEGDSVLIEGKAGKLGVPFSFRAAPGVTPRGALGLDLEKVSVLGIGVRGFLDAFEGRIEKAARKQGAMVDVDGNWLVIDPFPFMGPPAIHATFTSVVVHEGGIVARLGELSKREEARKGGGVELNGGALRSAKMILLGASLRLVAQDGGALVIDPATMVDQLADGVVKTLKNGDVVVYLVAPGDAPADAVETPAAGPEAERKAPGEAEEEVK